jgi:energy-coupling factor transporter transmembrane protein EcfT
MIMWSVYRYVHLYTCVYMNVYIYILRAFMCVCVCAYICRCIHLCVYMCMCLCVFIYVHVCLCRCICAFLRSSFSFQKLGWRLLILTSSSAPTHTYNIALCSAFSNCLAVLGSGWCQNFQQNHPDVYRWRVPLW